MVGYAGSPTRTVYFGLTLTRSKDKVKVTGLLNLRQLAKPCMLAAMTAAPLRGFLVKYISTFLLTDLVFLLFVVAISFLLLESYDHLLFFTVQHSSAVLSNDVREPM